VEEGNKNLRNWRQERIDLNTVTEIRMEQTTAWTGGRAGVNVRLRPYDVLNPL
jgi:hypothetical protein